MTPLEEIEQAIEYVREESDDDRRAALLAPLFIARAIHNLEATVRVIGVQWQQYADIVVPIMQRVDARTEAERAEALTLRTPPAEPQPANICQYCGKPLGEQHSPHCSRQGKVSADSLRV